jgi:hypothetical protein
MSDYTHLLEILTIEEKLRPHAGFPNLKKVIDNELKALELAYSPVKVVPAPLLKSDEAPEEPLLPIFPADSGVLETDTQGDDQHSDRRV